MTATQTISSQTSNNSTSAATPIASVLASTDHKATGRLFIGGSLIGLIVAAVVSAFSSLEAASTNAVTSNSAEAAQLWSAGRELLFFAGVVPLLVGLAIYIVPLQIGASSLAFARGAAASFWVWLFSTGLLVGAYIRGGGPGSDSSEFVVLWSLALAGVVGSIIWALVCVLVTVSANRTKGMHLDRAPLATWSFFVFSLLGLFSLPVTVAELILSYMRVNNMGLLSPGESPTDESTAFDSGSLAAVVDGVSFAPAIFWLAVPVMGLSAEIISVHSGHRITKSKSIMVAIGLLGLISFAPTFLGFGSVREIAPDNAFRTISVLAAPFAVLAVLVMASGAIRKGAFVLRAPLVAAILAGKVMMLGTLVGLLSTVNPLLSFWSNLAPNPVDYETTLDLFGTSYHDSVRVLVVGSALLAGIAGIHHWAQKLWGHSLSNGLGLLAALAVAAGSFVWAMGELFAGIDGRALAPINAIEAGTGQSMKSLALVGALILVAGVIIQAADVVMSSLGRAGGSQANPWGASTLEWATESPPVRGNFAAPPVVESSYPLDAGELTYDTGASDNQQLSTGEQNEPQLEATSSSSSEDDSEATS